METLVLNSNFVAIQLVNWQKAIKLVFLEKADVIDENFNKYNFRDWCDLSQMITDHPSGFIHTPLFKIAVPEIIALKFYNKFPKGGLRLTRKNIYEFYGFRCCYCGQKFSSTHLNIDHIIPRSKGGKTEWTNIVTSCINCNLKKGNRTPEEAGMKLVIKPSEPTVHSKIQLAIRSPLKIKSSWQKFINHLYWNIELEK